MKHRCPICKADICLICGYCKTEHNEDPVENCPGTLGNPCNPIHNTSVNISYKTWLYYTQGKRECMLSLK